MNQIINKTTSIIHILDDFTSVNKFVASISQAIEHLPTKEDVLYVKQYFKDSIKGKKTAISFEYYGYQIQVYCEKTKAIVYYKNIIIIKI